MKRSKHTLSHYMLNTSEMGTLHPIGLMEVLPGDTIQHSVSALIRISPLNTPVMHPVTVRIHHFFVPNRLVWPESEGGGWENFITGGPDGMDTQTVPTVNTTLNKRSVLHNMGLPNVGQIDVSALPLRGFNMIFNEFYRDQDLHAERDQHFNDLPNIAWEKDYFTTARPWTQKGPEITIPITGLAPVTGIGTSLTGAFPNIDQDVKETPGPNASGRYALAAPIDPSNIQHTYYVEGNSASGRPQIFADLQDAAGADINDFRKAFALQRYQEARAKYGSRYTEYLRYCGIRPSDARLQRPEYLGGGSSRINFSEVLQTSPDEAAPGGTPGVGDLWGHGIAGVKGNRYRKFFEEHGYIHTLMSIRPKAIYTQGVERTWMRQDKEDFFQKELQQIGQQEIWNGEIYNEEPQTGERNTFGYQDRYSEYKHQESRVTGEFLTTLDAWHLGRVFDTRPVLNQAFIKCEPSKRIFQVTDDAVDSIWSMINHHVVARRLVSKGNSSRIL